MNSPLQPFINQECVVKFFGLSQRTILWDLSRWNSNDLSKDSLDVTVSSMGVSSIISRKSIKFSSNVLDVDLESCHYKRGEKYRLLSLTEDSRI